MAIINISIDKQMLIMAQSTQRLALEFVLATRGKNETIEELIKRIGNTTHTFQKQEMELYRKNVEELKIRVEESQKNDLKKIEKQIALTKTMDDLFSITDTLSETEQLELSDLVKKQELKIKQIK